MRRTKIILFLIGLLASIILTSLLINFTTRLEDAHKNALDDQIKEHFLVKSTQVESTLNLLSNHLISMSSFVEATRNDDDFRDQFVRFASSNQSLLEGVRNYSIAPNGIQRYVYPITGNEKTLGHNLYEDPRKDVQEALERMQETRSAVINGPYSLRQGGQGLILRSPIYENDELWGIVNVVLDIDYLIAELALDHDPYFQYNIGTEEISFNQNDPLIGESLQTISFPYFDQTIIFTGLPKLTQWPVVSYRWFRLLGFVSIMSILFLYTLLLIRNHRLDQQLLHASYYDTLTELPNRRKMNEEIQCLIDQSIHFFLIYLDIDNFKELNDVYGHSVGDKLLKAFSKRLKQAMLPPHLYYRWGGDEFILVCVVPDSPNALLQLKPQLHHLESVLAAEYHLGSIRYPLRLSMGITEHPTMSDQIDGLIQQADTAMYHAKLIDHTAYAFYETAMYKKSEQSLEISLSLRDVLQKNGLTAYFQPIIDLETGCIIGAEALARWFDDKGNVIHSPNEFIPIAEQTGLIKNVSFCILQQSIDLIAIIREKFQIDFPIAVNLAGTEIDDELIQWLRERMNAKNLPYSSLEFEITERMAVAAIPKMYEHLNALRAENFRISLDDFGTSQSTLRLLQDLPIDTIKIDQRFVNGLVSPDTRDATIIRSILALARELSLEVIAEGVETKTQRNLLLEFGCKHAQGYLYYHPQSVDQLLGLLDHSKK